MESLASRLWWGVRWGGGVGVRGCYTQGAHIDTDSTEEENSDQEYDDEDEDDDLSVVKNDKKYQKLATKDSRQVV